MCVCVCVCMNMNNETDQWQLPEEPDSSDTLMSFSVIITPSHQQGERCHTRGKKWAFLFMSVVYSPLSPAVIWMKGEVYIHYSFFFFFVMDLQKQFFLTVINVSNSFWKTAWRHEQHESSLNFVIRLYLWVAIISSSSVMSSRTRAKLKTPRLFQISFFKRWFLLFKALLIPLMYVQVLQSKTGYWLTPEPCWWEGWVHRWDFSI